MRRVSIVCEGLTEEAFVHNILAPALLPIGLAIHPRMVPTSPGCKGGGLVYERVRKFLSKTLLEDQSLFVTTMFDLYGLKSCFPGYKPAQEKPLEQKLIILKEAMKKDIIDYTSCNERRFIPYIQPYEFEALLFSDLASFISIKSGWEEASDSLLKIREEAQSPEHINNHIETKPSAHLGKYLKNPSYNKTLHGPLVAAKIGLTRIEQECKFFATWLKELRSLGNLQR